MKSAPLLTVREFRRLPPETRCQLVEGGLVMEPSPSLFHQDVTRNLGVILSNHVTRTGEGKVYFAPLDVYLSEHDVFQPDVMFVARENFAILRSDGVCGAPDLIVEVLSPSTARLDARTKLRIYAEHGAREMWLVDPILLQIHRYDFAADVAKPVQLIDEEETFSTPLLPGLVIAAADVFRR